MASSRVRGFWIVEELEKMGCVCTLRWRNSKLGLIVLLFEILRQDVIVFQKTYSRYHRWLMVYARFMGKSVYLDIDDAPSRVNSKKTIQNFESMALTAHGVFVGSQKLYDYVIEFGGNAHLLPTGVKLENYAVIDRCTDSKPICIGWIGNGPHYQEDLVGILKGPLSTLAEKHDIRLKIVGARGCTFIYDGLGNIEGLPVEFVDNLKWDDSQAIMREIIEFDIGVYPLLSSEFNEYKCGFKALEYMAIGVPIVASRNSANTGIISDGVDGFFASDEAMWASRLEMLIQNPGLRAKMGRVGRVKVESEYDIPIVARRLLQILNDEVR